MGPAAGPTPPETLPPPCPWLAPLWLAPPWLAPLWLAPLWLAPPWLWGGRSRPVCTVKRRAADCKLATGLRAAAAAALALPHASTVPAALAGME
ncbi:hypothetical protein V8C86DRAFT_2470966 [Haematococcus lacustris]